MKIKSVECESVFPTPFWYVEYEDYEEINQAILAEIARVDWSSEHAQRGLQYEVENRHHEDIFITPESVPSSVAIINAFGHHCLEIARVLAWDLENNELRITDLWAHVTLPGKNTQTHHHAPAQLSCAYYVKAAAGCGNLRFIDDRKHRILRASQQHHSGNTFKGRPHGYLSRLAKSLRGGKPLSTRPRVD
jgi:uncharacterized protein (TIGR02466 family)